MTTTGQDQDCPSCGTPVTGGALGCGRCLRRVPKVLMDQLGEASRLGRFETQHATREAIAQWLARNRVGAKR